MRRAWNTRVAGWVRLARGAGTDRSTSAASCSAVSTGVLTRVSTMAREMRPGNGSFPEGGKGALHRGAPHRGEQVRGRATAAGVEAHVQATAGAEPEATL